MHASSLPLVNKKTRRRRGELSPYPRRLAQHCADLVLGERALFEQRGGDLRDVQPMARDGLLGPGVELDKLRRGTLAGKPQLFPDLPTHDGAVGSAVKRHCDLGAKRR
jgi:hypothetical protein